MGKKAPVYTIEQFNQDMLRFIEQPPQQPQAEPNPQDGMALMQKVLKAKEGMNNAQTS